MEQEFYEVAVEMNSIFENMSIDVLSRIPEEIRNLFKNNASDTYVFRYDKTKSLAEQNLKDKTKGMIALLYRDYLCDEIEKKEYNDLYNEYLRKEEEEKRNLYNPDDLFKKHTGDRIIREERYLNVIDNDQSFIKRIFNKILSCFKSNKNVPK